MSDYVFDYTKKTISFRSDPVFLVQYMVFRNRSNSEKYMMVKLENQTSRDILEVKLEFLQLDPFNQKISKTHYVFADLNMDGYSKVVPYEIIRVHEKFDSVECRLLHVKADDGTWQEGIWQSFETDRNDEDTRLDQVELAEEGRVEVVAVNRKRAKYPVFMTFVLIAFYLFILAIILFPGLFIR